MGAFLRGAGVVGVGATPLGYAGAGRSAARLSHKPILGRRRAACQRGPAPTGRAAYPSSGVLCTTRRCGILQAARIVQFSSVQFTPAPLASSGPAAERTIAAFWAEDGASERSRLPLRGQPVRAMAAGRAPA